MDPLSITVGCLGIIGAIAKTSTTIRQFVGDVREARRELGATARHLTELDMTINLIKDDHSLSDGDSDFRIPEAITTQTMTVIKSCHDILAELDALMEKHNPRRHQAPFRWALKGKDEVSALNRQLEAHTRALSMALEISMLSVPLTETSQDFTDHPLTVDTAPKSVKVDTAALGVVFGQIREDTTQLRKDTEQILSEMNRLRLGFGSHPLGDQPNQGRIDIIERYLDSLTNYAETVVDSFDDNDGGSPPPSASPGGETAMMPPSDQGSTPPIPRSSEADIKLETNGVPQNLDPQPERGGVGDVLPCNAAGEEDGKDSTEHGGDDLNPDPADDRDMDDDRDPNLDNERNYDPDDEPDYDPDDYADPVLAYDSDFEPVDYTVL